MTADDTARRVLLFSGHMIDAPGRAVPRFPPAQEPVARAAIEGLLQRLGTGPDDLAICGGACGGDLLFAETALASGARLAIHLPFDELSFLRESVDFAGPGWHARYRTVARSAEVHLAPIELGPLPDGADPYERNNLWMLAEAQRRARGQVVCICLWNGQGGDGPGGTQHLMQVVQDRGGEVHWLDTTKLWH